MIRKLNIERKIIKRNWLNLLLIFLFTNLLAITTFFLTSSHYQANIEILVTGENKNNYTEILKTLIKTSSFRELVLNNSENQKFKNNLIKEQNNWETNIETEIKANKQIISINCFNSNKEIALNTLNGIKNIFKDNKIFIFYDNLEEKDTKFSIINSTRIIKDKKEEYLKYYLFIGIVVGFLLDFYFFYHKYSTLRHTIRKKYKRSNVFKINKKNSLENIFITNTKSQTEKEVKDKLNRLIRGDDIVSELKTRKTLPKSKNSDNLD